MDLGLQLADSVTMTKIPKYWQHSKALQRFPHMLEKSIYMTAKARKY
jgi:hypothetical protein